LVQGLKKFFLPCYGVTMSHQQAAEIGFKVISLFDSPDDLVRVQRVVKAGRVLYGLLSKTASPSPVAVFFLAADSLLDCLQEYLNYKVQQKKTELLLMEKEALEQSLERLKEVLSREESMVQEQFQHDCRLEILTLHHNIDVLHTFGRHLRELSSLLQEEECSCMTDKKTMQALQKAFFKTTVQYGSMLQKVI